MGRQHSRGVESSAALLKHPMHPMLIVFPAASLLGTVATDLAFRATDDLFWASASWWLLLVGLITGLIAALAGAIDYFGSAVLRRLPSAQVHAIGNLVALVLVGFNLLRRWDDPSQIDSVALILTFSVAVLLGVTSWLGGELSYRHGAGMIANERER